MKNASLRTNHPGKRWIHMVRRCSVTLPVLLIWFSVLLGACSGEPATGIQTRSVGGLPGFGLSRDDLVTHLLADNSGIDYSNVRLTCNDRSAGTFEDATMSITPTIGFTSGVILSSGLIQAVDGPNSSDRITSDSEQDDRAGDLDLNRLIKGTTVDACALEFDFVPGGNTVTFRYVFASDEYPEYVGKEYNDAFAFYVNQSNYARLPNGAQVTINTINATQNSEFYIDNERDRVAQPLGTEMDGLTKPIEFTAPVKASQSNHMKLVIADVSDSQFDSVVFIEGGSLRTDTRATPVATGIPQPSDPTIISGTSVPPDLAGTITSGTPVPPGSTPPTGIATPSVSDGTSDPTPTPTTGYPPPPPDGEFPWLWIGLGLLLLAIIAVILLFLRRRGGGTTPYTGSSDIDTPPTGGRTGGEVSSGNTGQGDVHLPEPKPGDMGEGPSTKT